MFRPNVDIDATDREYRVTVEVPGVDEKDVKLELSHDGTLTIKGEKKQEREEKTATPTASNVLTGCSSASSQL